MSDYSNALIKTAFPYWEAEAEIAKRFFASRPGREAHLYWLRAQIWKELNPVDGYFNGLHRELHHLVEQFPRIDKTLGRHEFGDLLKQLLEEFNHYVLFADVLEFITQAPLTDADKIQLAEERRLQEVRQGYTGSGSELDRAAVLFTEGGGARLFREGAKVTGGELETRIANAMQIIYDDEKDHFLEALEKVNQVITSDADFRRVADAIVAVSRQRVAMRQEMFGYPLDEEELEAFIVSTASAARERGDLLTAQ